MSDATHAYRTLERWIFRDNSRVNIVGYGISTLHLNDRKHLSGPIWRVTLFENLLVLAHARMATFAGSVIFIALYTVSKSLSVIAGVTSAGCMHFAMFARVVMTRNAAARRL